MDRMAVVIFGFFGFLILVRIFPKADFGVWALFLTVAAFIEVGRNGLIQNALIKFLASADKKDHPTIITASLVLNCVLTLISVALLFFLGGWLSDLWDAPIMKVLFYQYIFTTIALIPFSQFNFIQQANFDFKGIFIATSVRQGSFFFFILGAYLFNFNLDLTLLVQLQTFAAIAGSIAAFFFVRKYLSFSKIDWSWVSKLFHFGKFVFGTNLGSMLFKTMDSMMLGSMVAAASVASYNIAIRITNLVEVPTTSVAAAVFPQSAKRMATEGKGSLKYLYEKSVGLILALILPCLIFFMLFSEIVIVTLAGAQYLDAVPVLRITIFYCLFIPFARQFGTMMDSIGKPKLNFYMILATAGMTIIFNYIFIRQFGLIGAAYGSLLTYFIAFLINQVILYRELKVNALNAFSYTRKFYLDGMNFGMTFLKKRLFA